MGKTTLARQLATELGATYLRIDAIEQAIRAAGAELGVAGYLVGYAVAESNLAHGQTVVADSVNPLGVTRQAWRDAAARAGARCVDVLVICSDQTLHRRRVEERAADLPGLRLPSWADVCARETEAWDTQPLIVDTARASVAAGVAAIRAAITPGQGCSYQGRS